MLLQMHEVADIIIGRRFTFSNQNLCEKPGQQILKTYSELLLGNRQDTVVLRAEKSKQGPSPENRYLSSLLSLLLERDLI